MITTLAIILAFGLAILTWFGFVPPYSWFSKLQSSLWGVDIVNISLILSAALFYAPMHVVVVKLEARFGVEREPLSWRRLVALVNFFFETWPGKVAGFGLIILLMGGYFWGRDASAGPLSEFTMDQVNRGEQPPSRFVHLTGGEVQRQAELSFTRNSTTEYYYPFVSTGSERIRAFVVLGNAKDRAQPPSEITGDLVVDGLPGPLRSQLEEKDLLAPDHFVIRHGRDPHREQEFALKMLAFGALLFLGGLAWARSRRPQHPTLPQG